MNSKDEQSFRNIAQNLQLTRDLACDKKIEHPCKGVCDGCDYFYIDGSIRVGRCLKRNVLDWAHYRLEEE